MLDRNRLCFGGEQIGGLLARDLFPNSCQAVVLAQLCQAQVRKALDAFVDADVDKAQAVIKDDDLLDALYHNLFNELLALMMEDPRNIRRANSLLFVAKHLERLGDHATNVAEMVVYMVRGTDVRHPHSRENTGQP